MDLLGQLQTYLRDDEQLLWYGTPDPRVRFTPADVFMAPFSILWCAFAIFWESGVVRSGGPVIFELWGIPFVAVGLYFVFGRFFYKRYHKSRTAYVITTRRAMIVSPRSFADMPLRDQAVTIRRARDSRHASVTIGSTVTRGRGMNRRTSASYYGNTGMELFARNAGLPFAFYDVADPDAMLHALDQARSQPAA
jgi:hypothetical protein